MPMKLAMSFGALLYGSMLPSSSPRHLNLLASVAVFSRLP